MQYFVFRLYLPAISNLPVSVTVLEEKTVLIIDKLITDVH